MSIKRIPGKGLLIEMGDYIRLRASMGGSDFWYPDYQKILLEKFKPFLPRMEYNPADNTVTASIVENGEELLSSSTSDKIPERELKKFKDLLKQIQEEVEQAGTDPDIKRVIKAFRLPDPGKAPELYRVYGKRRLAIIWGLEKQVESSIPVIGGEIVKTLTENSDKKGGAFKWLCCGAIVAAIAALVWWASPFDETEPPTQEGAVVTVPVDSAIDNLAKQVIYKVLILKNGQPVETATAFAASADGILVTNAHVAKEFGSEGVKYQVESTSGKRYPVEKVTHINVEDDVALLKIAANSIPYLKLRKEQEPRRGEYVYIPGYPLGAPNYFLATGKVTSVDDKGHSHDFFHDAAVSPGSSGSPVVDTHGQAVGVVVGNISDEKKQAQRLNVAVWVGVLKDAPIQQPSTGHLILPENVETKPVPTTTEVEARQVEKAPVAHPGEPSEPDEVKRPAASADPQTAAKDAEKDKNDAKQAREDAERAAKDNDPVKAIEAAEQAREKASDARNKAAGARQKADETQEPEDQIAADVAQKNADEAGKEADKAEQAAAAADPRKAAEDAEKDRNDAKQAREDAERAAKDNDPVKAEEAAEQAREKADDADNKAAGARQKADATQNPEDQEEADDAQKSADEAGKEADKAEQVAASADPQKATEGAEKDKEDAKELCGDAERAATNNDPVKAEEALNDARKKARGADDKAKGAEDRAQDTKKPEDQKTAEQARSHALQAIEAVIQTEKKIQRTVSVELPDGILIEARVLTQEQDAQGRLRVLVHVEAPDFERGTIKGKEIDSNRNVEILIDQNGEEIPYEIYRRNSKYPTTGGCRINVN